MCRGVVVMTLMQLEEEEDDEDADEEADEPTDQRPVKGHCCVMLLDMGDGLLLAVVLVVAHTSKPDGLL